MARGHWCHLCPTRDCTRSVPDGDCLACYRAANEILDRAARESGNVRRWYRDAGITGLSRHLDKVAHEVRFNAALARVAFREAGDASDPDAWLLEHPDGDLVVAHVLNGRSLRDIARDEGMPFSTLRRRYLAALAWVVDQKLVFGRSGDAAPPVSATTSPLDDAA